MAENEAAPSLRIPILRARMSAPPSLDPRDYARSTCYPAGHLVAKERRLAKHSACRRLVCVHGLSAVLPLLP